MKKLLISLGIAIGALLLVAGLIFGIISLAIHCPIWLLVAIAVLVHISLLTRVVYSILK